MTLRLLAECLLDGLLLAACALCLFDRRPGRPDVLLPLVCAGLCCVIRVCFSHSGAGSLPCVLLPADNLLAALLLTVPALTLNSAWFRAGEGPSSGVPWHSLPCICSCGRSVCSS